MGGREIRETYLNSASKNTSETDIFPHGPKSLLTTAMCPSSGETTMFVRHLVLVMLCGRLVCIPPCIPDSHPHRITSTKCRINTVVTPDDGHVVVLNM